VNYDCFIESVKCLRHVRTI